jgi:hypothetical protein
MTTHDQHTTYTEPTEGSENSREGAIPAPAQASDPGNAPTSHAESARQTDAPLRSEEPDRQVQSDWSDGQGRSADQTDAAPTQTRATVPQPEAAVVSSEPSSAHSVHETIEPSTEASLFADDELAGLSARWDSVQAAFVDDPRECVQKADGLVSDVMDQLTAGFSDTRARLEERWARGEDASTEDLRVALKQYREFFQRLLAV